MSDSARAAQNMNRVRCPDGRLARTVLVALSVCLLQDPAFAATGARVDPQAVLDAGALRTLTMAPLPERVTASSASGAKMSAIGRPFRFTLPFSRGAQEPATWAFDVPKRTLALRFVGVGATDGEGVQLDYFEQPSRRRSEPGGDVAPTPVVIARELDAVFVALPEGGVDPTENRPTYRTVVPGLSRPDAEALAASLVVELEGRIGAFASGAPNRCSLIREDASATLTRSRHLALCAVALSVETIRFKTADGRIVAYWPGVNTDATPRASDASFQEIAQGSGRISPAPPIAPSSTTTSPPGSAGLATDRRQSSGQTFAAAGAPPPASLAIPTTERDGLGDGARRPSSASAPAPSGPLAIRWLHSPEPERVEEVYPLAAFKAGRGGVVELECLELTDGRVRNCRVLAESPPQEGFGRAAVKLSSAFRLEPVSERGEAVEAWVRIPYTFVVTD